MSDDLIDFLRNLFVLLWFWSFLPVIFASGTTFAAEKMEIEFRAFRLQQIESSGKLYGSRSWKLLYEAVSINESTLRKCMVVLWRDLASGEDVDRKLSGPVGAVLIIIPKDITKLSESEQQDFMELEKKLAMVRTDLAIYFAPDSTQLRTLIKNVNLSSSRAKSAFKQLTNSIVADNYQISSSNTASTNVASSKVFNVIAQLNAAERGRPYLFIVAYYDTYGIIPQMTVGSDSNGSGVAVLLELLVILSQLYSLPSHRARFNLVFVLSSGGKFSYQGSRSFIDDFNERYSDETISLAICLDALAKGDALYVHAAKVPSDGNANQFIQNLNQFTKADRLVELVTKKINLASDRLAWEHEIYNIRRIHSVTLSHFKNHTDPYRNTLLDTPENLDLVTLEENTKLIANSLIAFVFDLDSKQCASAKANRVTCSMFNEAIGVNRKRLYAWIQLFASRPRSIVVAQKRLVANLHEMVKRYAHNAHIAEVTVNDFTLYNVIEDVLVANIVKPAIFELLLALGICTYLYGIYVIAMNAQSLLEGTVILLRKYLQRS